jgi:hypothetical protein
MGKLRSLTTNELLKKAWHIRTKNFSKELIVSAPSAKTYITDHYKNSKNKFVNISVTGDYCELNCEHCKGELLRSMIHVKSPEELNRRIDMLHRDGCLGMLISGGSLKSGSVPLDGYYGCMSYAKSRGMRVIVHTGVVDRSTARNLSKAGVDQALIDVIGDQRTMREVCHLDSSPKVYKESLKLLKDEGVRVAPHVVIGLHFGKILGEYNAVKMISESGADAIVLVVLSPFYDTPMFGVDTPSSEEVARVVAITRILNPGTPVTLGCARPPGGQKSSIEKLAVQAGVNAIAYPLDETIEYTHSLGLKTKFKETCCSLL